MKIIPDPTPAPAAETPPVKQESPTVVSPTTESKPLEQQRTVEFNPKQVVNACSIDKIQQICKENPKGGTLVVFRQDSCGFCEDFVKIAQQAIGEKVSIVKAGIEDDECGHLADKYKVTRTPTAIYFNGSGKEVSRIPIAGRTWEQVRKSLERLPVEKRSQGSRK